MTYWMTIHEDTIHAEHGTYDMKIIAGNDSTSIISGGKEMQSTTTLII